MLPVQAGQRPREPVGQGPSGRLGRVPLSCSGCIPYEAFPLNRISILLVMVLALVVAACSSEGGASTAASPSEPAATPTAEPTPEATPASSEAAIPGASGIAIPSFNLEGDPELAGRFPDTVGGQPLTVQSFDGQTFAQVGGDDPTFTAFLDSIGAELTDVSVAFGGVMSGDTPLTVGAFRVEGASEDDLEREFIAASEEAGDITGMEQATVGGKDVFTAIDPSGETDASVYLYTKDDTLYFLTGSEADVAEILETLP